MEKRQRMRALSQQFKDMNPLAEQDDSNMDVEPTKSAYAFKFQLKRPNPAFPDKFFCTSVDEFAARDIESLNQEILKLIPWIQKRKRVFVLKWVDSEGIERLVAGNDDLETALNEMKGSTYE